MAVECGIDCVARGGNTMSQGVEFVWKRCACVRMSLCENIVMLVNGVCICFHWIRHLASFIVSMYNISLHIDFVENFLLG